MPTKAFFFLVLTYKHIPSFWSSVNVSKTSLIIGRIPTNPEENQEYFNALRVTVFFFFFYCNSMKNK